MAERVLAEAEVSAKLVRGRPRFCLDGWCEDGRWLQKRDDGETSVRQGVENRKLEIPSKYM